MRRFYLVTRDLHLYFGLFLSPFILAFCVSVFYLVHGLAPRPGPGASDVSRTVANLTVAPERRGGIIALLLGFLSCIAFLTGFRWLV